jgi:hypothetical protein
MLKGKTTDTNIAFCASVASQTNISQFSISSGTGSCLHEFFFCYKLFNILQLGMSAKKGEFIKTENGS